MILLASAIVDAGVAGREAVPLGGIDMTVRRNAFGRQVDSFEGDIAFAGLDDPVHAVFIRAPWVERVGSGVAVLASGRRPSRRGAPRPGTGHGVSSGDNGGQADSPVVR
jgi:glutamine amidotransferase PdxT